MSQVLYNTFCGRCLLKLLTAPVISKMAGAFMNSRLSKPIINSFIRSNNINMDDYKVENWSCFNEFFTRKLKKGKRPVTKQANILISPCDGYLTVYEIDADARFRIKDSIYSVEDLVQNSELAEKYNGGTCLVFRLTPSDYHRYIYPDNGTKGENVFIQGILHTVRPIAFDRYPVFKTNSREYTVLHTNNFDDVVYMEVGAMMVGRICNYHQKHSYRRGEEKGKFEFGGSTIILLLKKDIARINPDITKVNINGKEYRVKLGDKVGIRK